jgi:hypothetical protein
LKSYSPSQIATILEQRENVSSRCLEASGHPKLTRLVVECYLTASPSFRQGEAPILPIGKQSWRPVESSLWTGLCRRDEALGGSSRRRMPDQVLSCLPSQLCAALIPEPGWNSPRRCPRNCRHRLWIPPNANKASYQCEHRQRHRSAASPTGTVFRALTFPATY